MAETVNVGRHSENPITGEGLIKSEGWEEAIVRNPSCQYCTNWGLE